MALFQWDESFSVGVKEMDDQHRKLVAVINRLHDAMLAGKGNDVLQAIFNELVEYTASHFTVEEERMQATGYPGYLSHASEHKALVRQVSELQEKFRSGQIGVTVETANFLKGWLTRHILQMDKKYGPHLNAKGIR